MKNTRKNLDAVLENLRNEGKLTGTNAEVFHQNIGAEYAKFVKFCKTPRTDDEIEVALAPLRNAIGLYNDEMRSERLEAMQEMKPKEAMQDYLRTQCVTGFKLTNDKDLGYVVDPDEKVELDAYDFISTMCPVELNGIMDAACIFADNLARFEIKDDGAAISKKSLSEGYIAMRQRMGWDISMEDLSLGVLAKHMDEVCKMITFGIAPKMQSTDVKYINHAVIIAKSKADTAGTFQTRDEKTILRHMFRAIYTRYHKLPYNWQTSTRGEDKTPLTSEANKTMAENPKAPEFSPDKMPKAGEVTIGKAAPKKGAKKADKPAK